MTTEAYKAIWFECEHCERGQFADYSLDDSWHEDRAVIADHTDCEKCGKENHVIEEK